VQPLQYLANASGQRRAWRLLRPGHRVCHRCQAANFTAALNATQPRKVMTCVALLAPAHWSCQRLPAL
jgi:hypothetical protein